MQSRTSGQTPGRLRTTVHTLSPASRPERGPSPNPHVHKTTFCGFVPGLPVSGRRNRLTPYRFFLERSSRAASEILRSNIEPRNPVCRRRAKRDRVVHLRLISQDRRSDLFSQNCAGCERFIHGRACVVPPALRRDRRGDTHQKPPTGPPDVRPNFAMTDSRSRGGEHRLQPRLANLRGLFEHANFFRTQTSLTRIIKSEAETNLACGNAFRTRSYVV